MRTHCITIDLANQGRRQVRARFDGGRMSSDGGALLLQAVDQRIGLTRRLAACFVDHRNPRRCEHSLQRLLAQRLFGLALGYEDLCDHDRLRVRVVVRGDAGFCRDELMAWCEAAEGVDYVFGLAQNARLKRALASWSRKRRVVGKAEWLPGGVRGDNQRLVVTSLDRDPAAVRAAVLRARGHGEPDQGAAAGPVRGPDFGGDAAGEPVGGCTGPCSRTAWRGCGRRRRDSLWASGRDSRGATRGGQREVCSPCANSPSRTGRVPRNRSRLTQIWLREGIPERQGREISCRPASNSPLPGPVTPKSEAA